MRGARGTAKVCGGAMPTGGSDAAAVSELRAQDYGTPE